MSRTSDENWIETALQAYWKRFAAWVTDCAHRYWSDFFIRTEVNIIVLEAAFALLITALSIGALEVLYHDVIGGVSAAIATALTSTSTPLTAASISNQLEAVRTREMLGMSLLIAFIAAGFGFLVARFALSPARTALASQKQFIGNIAHELRTPLSIIKTNTEVRLLDTDTSTAARALHESNLEELDRISDIINNLLSLNALIRPERIAFDPVDVGAVAERVLARFADLARRKKLTVELRAAPARYAWGNAAAIEQVLMNLVKNALNYTKEGSVTVSVGPDRFGRLEVAVHDTGPGISEADLRHIFEPFYRGDRARTRSGGAGSGLGLTIVSELVKLHNGRISIQSAPGEGTSVFVTLPAVSATDEAHDTTQGRNEIIADFTNGRAPGRRGRRS